jgi:chorismate synthase
MSANSFGTRFVVTSFGESHGTALGVVIDGCPAGVKWDEALLLSEMARRRPGSSAIVSGRAEPDLPELLSGVFEGRTLGTPIAMIVRNKDQRSEDYKEIAAGLSGQPSVPSSARPGHADDVWRAKFGHSDPRGGGRSSGRETLSRVLAGAVAQMFLKPSLPALKVSARACSIGPYKVGPGENALALPEVTKLLTDAKAEGRSYGGEAEIRVEGAPAGLGQPVFRKLKADLASAFLGVGATAGVEIGEGFESVAAEGSEFHSREGRGESEPYGGLRGGISTGGPILAKVAFKPTSSVLDVAKKGRHDPCIVPRAIPVLEAMTWIVLAEHVLWARGDRI